MDAPDMRKHLQGLAGETIYTITQDKPNVVLDVIGDDVIVTTQHSGSAGEPVPIAWVQAAADRVFAGETLRIEVPEVGHRSAFVGAVLATLPGVEVLKDPQRARLAPGASS